MKTKAILSALFVVMIPVAMRAQDVAVPSPASAVRQPTPAFPVAADVEFAPRPVPLIASHAKSAESVLLGQKLADLDRLQKEIDELRAATGTYPQIRVRLQMLELKLSKVQLQEVKLTKTEKINIDFSAPDGSGSHSADLSELLASGSFTTTKDANNNQYTSSDITKALLETLPHEGAATVLASPELVVVSGRPASFRAGGEFPVPTAQSNSVEFRSYGTELDLTAIAIGNNRVRVHACPRISELDMDHAIVVNGIKVPGVSVRQCDFSTELEFGQSTVLMGMLEKGGAREGKNCEPENVMLVTIVTPSAVGVPPAKQESAQLPGRERR